MTRPSRAVTGTVGGLTGEIAAPLAKGAGVRVVADDDGFQVEVEPLE